MKNVKGVNVKNVKGVRPLLLKKGSDPFYGQAGFTMIEIIAVLVIVGILAAVAASRMMDTRSVEESARVDAIKAHLRYAQARAMGEGRPWGVHVTADSYYLFRGTNESGNEVLFPGENSLMVQAGSGFFSGTPLTVTFDAYGSPGDNTLTLVTSGGAITITRNTGYIP
ncbi:prepilin-type N-terminal cleavage/methylation domain-containing protein [Desulfobotulus sp. H1]|uniref:Prepilin-type N-terminal cleavage/methylation domain-containing protein n=1 Tax=Desulfobotulus pelophilus TaxID=2823377 RepID=A0ABT3NBZ1_9BACT|nr:GspH/FimT family pseudopilin [Desulfobotulus pelophilus]MCW7754472.1 prepilin-type N-terminal cleavage/methylation domain-containing protein [Desulfobotulus pelophilus]